MQELDFEEIDQVMEDMNNFDGITDAIAVDVAKVDASVVKKTTKKKTKPAKKPVVKNTTKKPIKGSSSSHSELVSESNQLNNSSIGFRDEPEMTVAKEATPYNDDGGELVFVKVKKQPKPEEVEEVVEFKPNPKTGKFMDIVSPLSDMSIQGARPSKDEVANAPEEVALITATSVVVTTTTEEVEPEPAPEQEPEEEVIEKDDKVADRERIEEAGLDPDAEIGDLASQLEEISDVDDQSDRYFDELLAGFDDFDNPEEAEPEEVATSETDDNNSINELEKLADIIDIPDRSDAFLSDVEIEKRPLGGGSAAELVGATAIAEVNLPEMDQAEAKADKEFIEDETLEEWLDDKKESKSSKIKNLENFAEEPKKKSNVVLYVLLIVLFVILGASLGVLAYFSGLF